MIDLHSHILPGMDDGAQNIEMSIQMLKTSFESGVQTVVSTSHCYPRAEENIDSFLARREHCFEKLQNAIAGMDNIPDIVLGCEVNITTDIAEMKNIEKLRISGTDYILVEMPHGHWKEWMIDSVYKLTLLGLKPIMAHIDRYMAHNSELLNALFELDVLYQVNTDLFLERRMKKFAAKLLETGHLHILGSDMHNLTSRKPNFSEAIEIIAKRYGKCFIDDVTDNASAILQNNTIPNPFISTEKSSGFLAKLFK